MFFPAVVLLVFLCLGTVGCAEHHTLPEVLANMRAAAGIPARTEDPNRNRPPTTITTAPVQTISAHGTTRESGDGGEYRLIFDPGGSVREEAKLRLGHVIVIRGEEGWMTDWVGETHPLLMGDLEQARLRLGVFTGNWLVPGAGFEIQRLSESSGQVELSVGVPGGLRPAIVLVNKRSWLPHSLTLPTDAGQTTWVFSDFREVAGRRLAHQITREWDGAEEVISLETAGPANPDSVGLFAIPSSRIDDYRFDSNLPPEVETRLIETGHVLVRPVINGHRMGWYFLDTGANANVISPQAAAAIGLEAFGEVEATGTGGTTMVDFRQADELRLGPITLEDPIFAAIDLTEIIPGVEGIIGYPLFRRSVVELNPNGAPVRVFPPGMYPGEVSHWEELTIAGRKAFVSCRFEGNFAGLFTLDTGHRMAVTFHTPTVDSLGLLEGRRTRPATGTGGVGGLGPKRRGVLDWFEIGDVRFEGPEVDFARTPVGGFSNPYSLGHVGMGLLYYFRVILDYPENRIAFIPPA